MPAHTLYRRLVAVFAALSALLSGCGGDGPTGIETGADRTVRTGGGTPGVDSVVVDGIRITDLGDFGGPLVEPVAINDRGEVVINTERETVQGLERISSFFWSRSNGVIELPTEFGADLNDHGAVLLPTGSGTSIWTVAGGTRSLGMSVFEAFDPRPTSGGANINDQGLVVGRGQPGDGEFLYAQWSPDGIPELVTSADFPGPAFRTLISDINDAGDLLLRLTPERSEPEEWLVGRPTSGLTRIEGLEPPLLSHSPLNNRNQVAGTTSVGGSPRGALWTPGQGVELLPRPALVSTARSVNDSGQVAGPLESAGSSDPGGGGGGDDGDGDGGPVILNHQTTPRPPTG